ncbi:hypothetical protein Emag_006490 [Eimeria magna]
MMEPPLKDRTSSSSTLSLSSTRRKKQKKTLQPTPLFSLKAPSAAAAAAPAAAAPAAAAPAAAGAAGAAAGGGRGEGEDLPCGGIRESVLFSPLRMIGIVTSNIPFSLSIVGKETFICCSMGRGFQIFNAARLQQQLVSPRLPASVRCLCASGSLVYVGLKTNIIAFDRLLPVLLFTKGHALPVDQLLLVGPLLLSRSRGEVVVWERKEGKIKHRIPLQGAPNLTLMLHADTYINKLLLARGPLLELWNFSTGQRLHQFNCINTSSTSSSSSSSSSNGSISAAAQSPSPEVIAVGMSCGRICVLDFVQDDLLLEFKHSASQGAVTALAFRSDAAAAAAGPAAAAAAAAAAVLVSGCANGDLCIWGLSDGRLLETVSLAHADAVVHVQFLPGEPIMLTNGHDNALIEWIFDSPDGIPRELRARRGQVGIISQMQFYGSRRLLWEGAEGTELLTASSLRSRGFVGRTSLIQQQQNCTYSQKNLKTKLTMVLHANCTRRVG